jgi:UDP-glucose 4-epimerase
MAKVLVAGGAGYIGSDTVLALREAGHEPVVFDDFSYGHRDVAERLEVPVIEGSLADRAAIDAALSGGFDGVMHFAAFTYVGESMSQPGRYYANNVAATLNLLQAMVEAEVSGFVFSSTCATYGVPQRLPLTEDHPQAPINVYGRTKLFVEQMLEDFDAAHGLRSIALRYFNAAGADLAGRTGEHHEPETHLIPLTLDVALGRRDRIFMFGSDYETRDGTCVRDYIHVSDIAQAHVLCLDHLLSGGKSDRFNLANGQGFTVREIIESVRRVTGHPIPAEEVERRPGDPAALIGDASRIRDQLGWEPQHTDLDGIVSSAWNWHRKRFG